MHPIILIRGACDALAKYVGIGVAGVLKITLKVFLICSAIKMY